VDNKYCAIPEMDLPPQVVYSDNILLIRLTSLKTNVIGMEVERVFLKPKGQSSKTQT